MIVTQPEHVAGPTLSDEWIGCFEKYSAPKTYPKGTLIFSEGDEADGLFVIREGKVKVYMSDDTGKEMQIADLGPRELVGEVASLDGQPRTASVTALETTKVSKAALPDFRKFLEENPELAYEIIRIMTSRIREHATSISNLAFKNVYGRVVWLLEKYSVEGESGTYTTSRKFTQQDIADMVGSSREMVSRVVTELVKGDYISIDQKIITIQKSLPRGW